MRNLITILTIFISLTTFGQNRIIKGKVVIEYTFEPLEYTIIKTKDTQVSPDKNGYYEINISPQTDTIEFQAIGFTTEYRIVNDSISILNIILMDKKFNCLGAIMTKREVRKAEEHIRKREKKQYDLAREKNIWND
jgi:CarboxypepD_reg-like domain